MSSVAGTKESFHAVMEFAPGSAVHQNFSTFADMVKFAARLKNDSVPQRSAFKASLIVERRDTYRNFFRDLLFPNFTHTTLRTHSLAMKLLSGLLTVPIDLLTLIPRLIFTLFTRPEENETQKENLKYCPQGMMTVKFYGQCKYTSVAALSVVKKVEGAMTVALRPLDKEVFASKFKYTCNLGLQKGDKTLGAAGLVKEADSSLDTTAIESTTLDAATWQMTG